MDLGFYDMLALLIVLYLYDGLGITLGMIVRFHLRSFWNSAMVSSVPTQPFLSPFPILPSSFSSFQTIEWGSLSIFLFPFRSIVIPPFLSPPSLLVDHHMVRHSVEVCANFPTPNEFYLSISLIFTPPPSLSSDPFAQSVYSTPTAPHCDFTAWRKLVVCPERRLGNVAERLTTRRKDAAAPCDDYRDPADGTVARIID